MLGSPRGGEGDLREVEWSLESRGAAVVVKRRVGGHRPQQSGTIGGKRLDKHEGKQ